MRIAQVAPLWERVPPSTYGGTELVVSLLTDELVRRGHDVTLFATGDSVSLAKLESAYPRAFRLDSSVREPHIYELLQLSQVYEQSHEFDIIHSHMDYVALPYAALVETPTVHTLHGVFTPTQTLLFQHENDQYYVTISNAQRCPELGLNYIATVYNGIAVNQHQFYPHPNDPPYLAFLGRMSPAKGPHLAINIAKQVGLPLKLAAKVDAVDVEYFQQEIEPHIDGEQIQFLGEVNHDQKNALMGGAIATLFPITWQEPFGLVMIESMAAGTPVIAMNLGSTPEVIAHGQTGFLCDNIAECVNAVKQVNQLNRLTCRASVSNRFNVQRMVDGYEAVYQQILTERLVQNTHGSGSVRSNATAIAS
jgi:glycosyltransferase involved in cell wall biosynthesis